MKGGPDERQCCNDHANSNDQRTIQGLQVRVTLPEVASPDYGIRCIAYDYVQERRGKGEFGCSTEMKKSDVAGVGKG